MGKARMGDSGTREWHEDTRTFELEGELSPHRQDDPSRSLSVIATEIQHDWKRPYFGAVPYIDAMLALNGMSDRYYLDSAESIVAYFLANAGSWRGEVARRVKAELKAMLDASRRPYRPGRLGR